MRYFAGVHFFERMRDDGFNVHYERNPASLNSMHLINDNDSIARARARACHVIEVINRVAGSLSIL